MRKVPWKITETLLWVPFILTNVFYYGYWIPHVRKRYLKNSWTLKNHKQNPKRNFQ